MIQQLSVRKTALFFLLFLAPFTTVVPSFLFAEEFHAPSGIAVDPETGNYYVSNMNGLPMSRNGKGYVSMLSSEGFMLNENLIGKEKDKGKSPLDSPAGLAIAGRKLFVADIDRVKIFDKLSGRFLGVVDFSAFNPKGLMGITLSADGKNIIATDPYNNAIYSHAIEGEWMELVSKTSELGRPMGVTTSPKTGSIFVAGYESGDVYRFSRKTGMKHTIFSGEFPGIYDIDFDKEGNLVLGIKTGEIVVLFKDKTYKILYRNLSHFPGAMKLNKKNGMLIVAERDPSQVRLLAYRIYGKRERH